jgi:tetraacyldisaccharide 4'-kinase
LIQETLVRILLSPLALIYGGIISLRNLFYKKGLLRSIRFDIPIISIGNLSVGGTGKTPHIEYLVTWLKEYMPVAILSRGYRRKSAGFQIAQQHPDVQVIGDEPYQFWQKFPDIPIAVAENRELAVPALLKAFPESKLILLDDAFQHLSIKPYINILLTSYDHPFTRDSLLPAGRLREWKSSYTRADIILITKCPRNLSQEQAKALVHEIKPFSHQHLFFTYYRYQLPYYIIQPHQRLGWHEELYIVLISAIANTEYLEQFISRQVKHVQLFSFADHHWFSNYDMGQLKRQYDALPGPHKAIITTEKDATRLQLHRDYIIENKLPIFVLPVAVEFLWNEEDRWKEVIMNKLLAFTV